MNKLGFIHLRFPPENPSQWIDVPVSESLLPDFLTFWEDHFGGQQETHFSGHSIQEVRKGK